jgi:hypothetical protein
MEITRPARLVAETGIFGEAVPGEALPEPLQALYDEALRDLEIPQGELKMFIVDVPDMPLQQAVVIAHASQSASKSNRYAMGMCLPVPFVDPANREGFDSGRALGVVSAAEIYFRTYHKGLQINEPSLDDAVLVSAPKFGKVVTWRDKDGLRPAFAYEPNPGYEGNDKLVFEIRTNQGAVRLVYLLKVSKLDIDRGADKILCKKTGDLWKISSCGVEFEISDLDTRLRMVSLSNLLGDLSRADVTFAPLPGYALGSTIGKGVLAQITLDSTAAGHGWYADATPLTNDEYLPTADPQKMGSGLKYQPFVRYLGQKP